MIPLLLAIWSEVADVATTFYGFSLGGSESNPIFAPMLPTQMVVVKAGLCLCFVVAWLAVRKGWLRPWYQGGFMAVFVWTSLVAFHNALVTGLI